MRLATALLGLLTALCGGAPAQQREPEPAREIWLVPASAAVAAARAPCLAALRTAIRRRDPAAFDAALSELEQRTRAAQEPLVLGLAALGGRRTRCFWPFGSAVVELPPGRAAELQALTGCPAPEPDRRYGPHLERATNAANHAADHVQESLGLSGTGATLALLDTGIDADCGGGDPHPAFGTPGRDGFRIVRLHGAAFPSDHEDRVGHGTRVAAIAVARDWDPGAPGSDDGFAPGAAVASYKITFGGGRTYRVSDLIAALGAVVQDRVRHSIVALNLSFAGDPLLTGVTQQALDMMGSWFDVLVVTSAGNDGAFSQPTRESLSNANGLAVGAVHADTHVVWEHSSPGPLVSDTRLWPDLMAVGVAMRLPEIDRPLGVGLPVSGTSFAAPAVAGTALLVRSANPELDALDAKAVILNNVADLTARNPGLTRLHLGLGLLRTDLAVEAALAGEPVRGTLSRTQARVDVPFHATAGRSYAATLCWHRRDVTTADWDDLDLDVVDPSGRVLAVSETPRNLYERVLFDAHTTGAHRLRIHVRSLSNDGLPWSLACGENRGGGRQEGTFETFGQACPGTGVDPALGTVLPPFQASQSGNSRLSLPFATERCRVMQILDGSWLLPGVLVDRIAWRRDEDDFGAPSFTIDLSIGVAYANGAPNQLSTRFADNVASETQIVLDRPAVDLPGTFGRPAGPAAWEYVVPLDRPFLTATSPTRHLLLDVRVRDHVGSPPHLWFDAHIDHRVAMVYAIGDPWAAVGLGDPVVLPVALGSAALGRVAPWITVDRAPQLGSNVDFVLRRAAPGAPAALVHGGSDASWSGVPLPFDLGALGAPGCALHCRPDVLLPAIVGPAGQATVRIAIPADPDFTGAEFFDQFLVLDPTANALGLAATAGGRGRVGG